MTVHHASQGAGQFFATEFIATCADQACAKGIFHAENLVCWLKRRGARPQRASSPLNDLETHDPRRRAFAKPAAWLHPPAFNLNPAVTQSMRAGLAGALERIEANVPEKAGVQFVADVEPGKLRVVAGGVAQ